MKNYARIPVSVGTLALASALFSPACGATGLPGAPDLSGVPGGPSLPGGCDASKFDIQAGVVGDFGEGAGAAKLEGFLRATIAANGGIASVETDLVTACSAIATDLGVPAAELEGGGAEPGARVRRVCGAMAAKLSADLRAKLPQGARLVLAYSPPVCAVNMQAVAQASAQCDANVSADAEVQCDGHLTGQCSANCTGTCSGSCGGSCEGTCNGSCGGDCNGTCDGRCARRGPDGQCAGRCTGTCQGSCSANCQGSCSGTCTGSCDAQCSGECSVDFQAPRCEGQANVEASAECRAQANVEASADVECTEPSVVISVSGNPGADVMATLEGPINTLQANWPKILIAARKIEQVIRPNIEAFASASAGIAGSFSGLIGEVGAEGVACATSAGQVASGLAARAEASASVSVEMSASVSVQGEGSAGASACLPGQPPVFAVVEDPSLAK